MMYINILTHLREKLFIKQLPPSFENEGIIFKINSKEDIEWDAVVVYEDINFPFELKCKSGQLFFISGEPPIVKVYSSKFLDQFDYIVSAHTNIVHPNNHIKQQALPWYFGYGVDTDTIFYDYKKLETLPIPVKSKKISFIVSNREFLPGHIARLQFMEEIQKRYSDEIDLWGKGFMSLDDKSDGLLSYKFSICIENSTINDYWSEKIADPFLSYTVPIYQGCKNINSYFSSNSYIPINVIRKNDALKTIDKIIEECDSLYNEMLPHIIQSREQLLSKYNVYRMLYAIIQSQEKKTDIIIERIINSSQIYTDKKFANQILKLKRMSQKAYSKLMK
ncbi:hypothetical protein FACS1894181_07370 [Bacteroidia bacterium]|nr:hypothetical protein FACS1894181_07370 [Bacteroidia bacterium]